MVLYDPNLLLGLVIGEGAVLDVSSAILLVGFFRAEQIVDRLSHRHIGHKLLCVHPADTPMSVRPVINHHIIIKTLQNSPRNILGLSSPDHRQPGLSIGLQGRRASVDGPKSADLIAVSHSAECTVTERLVRLNVGLLHPKGLSAALAALSSAGAAVRGGLEAQVRSTTGGFIAVQLVTGPRLGREGAGRGVQGPI